MKGVKKGRGINWFNLLIPLIALGISIGMVVKYYQKKGLWVEVSFKDVRGITPHQTPVKYRGVEVGKVEEIKIDKDNLNLFILRLLIYPQYEYLVKKGTIFWKATLEISPDKISNLDTLLKGSYISLLPPTTKKSELVKLPTEFYFKGLEHPPGEKGYHFVLISQEGDLGKNAPIVYKGVQIGKLYSKTLYPDGTLHYKGLIFQPYNYLLYRNIKFYRIDPVKFKASIDSIQLKIPSLRLMLTGGVGLYVGDGGGFPKEKYPLYSDLEDIQYAPEVIKLVTTSKQPVSKVVYNNLIAGKVIDSEYDVKKDIKILKVKFKKEFFHLLQENPYFYIQTPKLSLTDLNLKKLITGAYIQMGVKGGKSKLKKEYKIMAVPPEKRGYKFTFLPNPKVKLKKGEKIFYRGVEVGEIEDVKLVKGELKARGKIYNRYLYLVNDSTIFYPISPLELKASLTQFSMKVAPLPQIIQGGITFLTLNPREKLTTRHFSIFSSFSDLQNWIKLTQKGRVITLYTPKLHGIKKGTPIYYDTFPIGEVLNYTFNPQSNRVEIKAFIRKKYLPYLNSHALFYIKKGIKVKASLSGVKVDIPPAMGLIQGAIVLEGKYNPKAPIRESFPLLTSQQVENRKFFHIFLLLPKSYSLKEGSPLIYKGVKIGEVDNLTLDPQKGVVKASIKIPNRYRLYFHTGAKIYLEKFQASINGVRNTSALITGGELHLLPSLKGKFKEFYSLDAINPPPTHYKRGVRFILHTPGTQPVSVGAPLYYKYVEIGEVEKVYLSPKDEGVDVEIFVPEKYSYLIRKGDKFRYFHPFKFSAKFLKFKMEMGTLPTLLRGGFILQQVDYGTPKAKSGTTFTLQPEEE